MANNDLYFFRKIIYQLKKRYGFDIGVYRTTEVVDLKTGRKNVSRMNFVVKKAIILPSSIFRDYGYATALRQLNTDLQVGGLLDSSQRSIIIDVQALPQGFEFNPNDYVVFKHRRYNIMKITELEVADFIQLDVKETTGEPVFEVHQMCMRQKLSMMDESIVGG